MTQRERILRALRDAPIRATAFALPNVIDDGPPIYRVAARIQELRDAGFRIETTRRPLGDAIYTLTESDLAGDRDAPFRGRSDVPGTAGSYRAVAAGQQLEPGRIGPLPGSSPTSTGMVSGEIPRTGCDEPHETPAAGGQPDHTALYKAQAKYDQLAAIVCQVDARFSERQGWDEQLAAAAEELAAAELLDSKDASPNRDKATIDTVAEAEAHTPKGTVRPSAHPLTAGTPSPAGGEQLFDTDAPEGTRPHWQEEMS